ncbi:MAG TPA: NADP-dependent oxidoreductase [Candidatus Acidoferrales bacterium]|nr:NADP-dependent oxidoreductase [Candidatus Acidoferrales bacterium]
MKAVVLHEYGGPEKLKYEEFADPQVNGDAVLIETTATSVNPIDWKIRSGSRQKDFPQTLPTILGRDVSGVVRAVGPSVKYFKVGDRVLALTTRTYAELVAVPESILTHLPDGVDLADSAAIPLVSLTGDQLVRETARVQSGQTVLISGAVGSVGRAAVHSAKKLGAQVIAGVRKRQVDEARTLGVAGVVAIDDDDAIANMPMVDVVADTVGGETAVKLIAKLKAGGSFGYAAFLPPGTSETHPKLKFARVFAKPDPSKLREFADDVRDGKFVLPIGKRLLLRDAAQAQVIAETGNVGKVLLLAK